MAGVTTGPITETIDVEQTHTFRIANTTTANCIALASGANGVTPLPLAFPKGGVIVAAFFHPVAKPGSTVTFSVGKKGTFVQGGSGQLGSYGSATLPSGALASANRASVAVDLSGSTFTAGTMTELKIHPAASGGTLNNNVIEPGGQVFVHTSEDVSAITFNGFLTLRVRETIS